MKNICTISVVFFIFLILGIIPASATVISFDPSVQSINSGFTKEIQITADEFPSGLSGYNLSVSVINPDIAEIVEISFPFWAALPRNSSVPATTVWFKTIDFGHVENGSDDVQLGTVFIRGKQPGNTEISISILQMDDESGNPIYSDVLKCGLSVEGKSSETDSEYVNKSESYDNYPQKPDDIDKNLPSGKDINFEEPESNLTTISENTTFENSESDRNFDISGLDWIFSIIILISVALIRGGKNE